jgi:predicted RNA-binding Zn ribbon-like protein
MVRDKTTTRMTDGQRRAFLLVGERLCLDFVNTLIVEGGSTVDLLGSFDDLTEWCASAEILSASRAREMTGRWSGTREAERTFAHAVHLRATLGAMVERIASGRHRVPQSGLDAINGVLHTVAGELTIVRTREGYDTRFRTRLSEPPDLLVPIAQSAADLLSSDDLTLVKKCQNPQCILHFYDTTKNHARRWCSMSGCGNRAKVAAHYQRTRRQPKAKIAP